MKKLYIFDFDDTLAVTSNVVHVHKSNGSKVSLASNEYPSYKKEEGDIFDFTDFRLPKDAKKIDEVVGLLLSAIEEHGINSVVILTARVTDEPVKHFLKQHNLPSAIQIMPVGREDRHSHPDDKAIWIRWVIDKFNLDEVIFFDDHPGNINAVQNIKSKHVKVKTHLIKSKSPI